MPINLSRLPTGSEARNYIVEKKLLVMVEQALEKMLTERPDNPTSHLASYLKDHNLVKRVVTSPMLVDHSVVNLRHNPPSVYVKSSPLPTVPNFRHVHPGVYGFASPVVDGWRAVLEHLRTEAKTVTKLVVIEVDDGQVHYFKGLPHVAPEYKGEIPLKEALRREGKQTVQDVGQVLPECMRGRDAKKYELATHKVAFRDSSVAPSLDAVDSIMNIVEGNRAGLLGDTLTTALLVCSTSGKDDVTVALSFIVSALKGIKSVQDSAIRKRMWEERVKEKGLEKKKIYNQIAAMHAEGVQKDDRRIAKLEVSSKNRKFEETAAEIETRRKKIEQIRAKRNAQWEKFELHLQAECCTKIAAVFRGHQDRLKVRKIREDCPNGATPVPSKHSSKKARSRKAKAVQPAPAAASTISTLKDVPLIRQCVRWFEETYGNHLLTRADAPRERKSLVRRELRPNIYKKIEDGTFDDYDDTVEELFTIQTVEGLEEELPTDFAVPVSMFLSILSDECSHIRNIGQDLLTTCKKYAGVTAVQSRVTKTVSLFAYGICFHVWVVLREFQTFSNFAPKANVATQNLLRKDRDSFASFVQTCDLYEYLRSPEAFACLPNLPEATAAIANVMTHASKLRKSDLSSLQDKVMSYLTHRVLSYNVPKRLAARSSMKPADTKKMRNTSPGAEVSLSRMEKTYVFHRFSRKLSVLSVPAVLDPEHINEVLTAVSQAKLTIWTCLTPDLTLWVKQIGSVVAELPSPPPDASSSAMQKIVDLCKLEAMLETKEKEKHKDKEKEAKKDRKERRRKSVQSRQSKGVTSAASMSNVVQDKETELKKATSEWSAEESDLVTSKNLDVDGVKAVKDPVTSSPEKADDVERGEFTAAQISEELTEKSPSASLLRGHDAERSELFMEESTQFTPRREMPHPLLTEDLIRVSSREEKVLGHTFSALEEGAAEEVATKLDNGGVPYTTIENGVTTEATTRASFSSTAFTLEFSTQVSPYGKILRNTFRDSASGGELLFVRQAVLPGFSPGMLKSLHTLAEVVREAVGSIAENEGGFSFNDLALVVGHSEELNAVFTTAVAAAFAVFCKKVTDEDVIETLLSQRAQAAVEIRPPSAPSSARHSEITSHASCHTPAPTNSDSDFSEDSEDLSCSTSETVSSEETTGGLGLTLTQRLMSITADVIAEESFDQSEPLLSPFPCIDLLVKSPLGVDMGLADALLFMEQLFECGNNHFEEMVVGGMAAAFETLSDPAVEMDERTRRRVVQKACRDVESYAVLLFYCAWLLATLRDGQYTEVLPPSPTPSRPSVASVLRPTENDASKPRTSATFQDWILTEHESAVRWVFELDPWQHQEQPKIKKEWMSHSERWHKEVAVRQAI